MQTHVAQLTKQRLSDFFVKEEGQVAHKNALAAGTVTTGAILASLMLGPDPSEAHHKYECGDPGNSVECLKKTETCCSGFHANGDVFYYCAPIRDGC